MKHGTDTYNYQSIIVNNHCDDLLNVPLIQPKYFVHHFGVCF